MRAQSTGYPVGLAEVLHPSAGRQRLPQGQQLLAIRRELEHLEPQGPTGRHTLGSRNPVHVPRVRAGQRCALNLGCEGLTIMTVFCAQHDGHSSGRRVDWVAIEVAEETRLFIPDLMLHILL